MPGMMPGGLSKREYYHLSRRERADLIDDSDVEKEGKGRWNVTGSNGNDYYVERLKRFCISRRCAGQDPEFCRHIYSCDCPDDCNPCKHIYKVHSMNDDSSDEEEGASDADLDMEDDSPDEEEGVPIADLDNYGPPPYTAEQRQLLLNAQTAKISATLDSLKALLSDPRFSIDVAEGVSNALEKVFQNTDAEMKLPIRY